MSGFRQGITDDVRNVMLLDGRSVSVPMGGCTTIASDMRHHYYDFSWCRPDVVWHASARILLVSLLTTHSLPYAEKCSYFFKRLAEYVTLEGVNVSDLTVGHLQAGVEHIGLSAWPFIQAVLGRWASSGYPGLADDVRAFLRAPHKFEEQGNGWYFALVANDPQRGAFTEQELRSVRDGVNLAFEDGKISLKDWALTWFLIATGVRPVQIARTTIRDVLVTDGPEGREITLSIPLAKGENQVVRDRWKRKAPTVLAEILITYMTLPEIAALPPSSPLFDDQSVKVSARIRRVFLHAKTHSDRLDGPVPVFPYRFRYTMGTRAIALGASDHEVARLLTHRTTHCVQYYRAALPMLQRPISDALGVEMTFMAHAFQGRLIGSLEEATRQGEPASVIRDFATLMGQSLGACGTRAECHLDAPRACLSCFKFEPLREAPWEDFLVVLMDDLASETEDRIRLITEEQISAVREIMAERDAAALAA